jgi:ADP-ribosylglycohydrolase
MERRTKLIMSVTVENRILGAFYGQALGDAMGMPSELWPRARVKSHFGWIDHFLPGPEENTAACFFKAGEYTDDTSMALALADAIVEGEGEIDPKLVAQNILSWVRNFDAFNKNVLGPTSKVALSALLAGADISTIENLGTTNGAAMRIAPLGCLMPTQSLDDFIELVQVASSPTHKADVAIAGAAVIAWAVSRAVEGQAWSSIITELPMVADRAQNRNINTFSASMASRIRMALELAQRKLDVEEAMEEIYNLVGAGTSTIESVPAAIAMVGIAKCDATRCAILCANLGGDTDTIGAMATAICGALNGFDSMDITLIGQLNAANKINFTPYAKALSRFRDQRENGYAVQ